MDNNFGRTANCGVTRHAGCCPPDTSGVGSCGCDVGYHSVNGLQWGASGWTGTCVAEYVEAVTLPTGYSGTMACGAEGSASIHTTDVSTCSGVTCATGYVGTPTYSGNAAAGGTVVVGGCSEASCAPITLPVGAVGGASDPCAVGTILTTATDSSCSLACGAGYASATGTFSCGGGPAPIARWTFDADLTDSVGSMDLQDVYGTSTIDLADGALVLDGTNVLHTNGDAENGPVTLTAKTMVAVVSLSTLQQQPGCSPMSVETVSASAGGAERFDAIVMNYGQENEWTAGSNGLARTQDLNGPNVQELSAGGQVHIAIVYGGDDTPNQIEMFRNGVSQGSYNAGSAHTFSRLNWGVTVGIRHKSVTWSSGMSKFSGKIYQMELYDYALTAAQVQAAYDPSRTSGAPATLPAAFACVENTCAPISLGVGVTSGDVDGCTDGLVLSTNTDYSCTIKCADGYLSATATVTCPPESATGAATTGDLSCVSATCAAPAVVAGRTTTGCSGKSVGQTGCIALCDDGYVLTHGSTGGMACTAVAGASTASFASMPTCEPCPDNQYTNSATGHTDCSPWRNCPAGQGRVAGTGSATADLQCEVCDSSGGEFNGSEDTSECGEHLSCPLGSGLTGASSTSAGSCAVCGIGLYSNSDAATPCTAAADASCPPHATAPEGSNVCQCDQYYEATTAVEWDNTNGAWLGECIGGLCFNGVRCNPQLFNNQCCDCDSGYYLAGSSCVGYGGACANGDLITPQSARTQENHCGVCDPGYYLSAQSCLGYGGACAHGELINQAARRQENHCGDCSAGYYLSAQSCIAWEGACANGALVAQASRTQVDHCGECDAGYHLVGSAPPACPAWAGTCTNGDLVDIVQRTQSDHCGSCNPGYYLVTAGSSVPTCAGYGGDCANGALIAQAARTQENQCGSCSPGYYLNSAACLPFQGTCENGVLRSQELRTAEHQCGTCNPGYFLDGVACYGYGGPCNNGVLRAQADRTAAGQCASCDPGYYLQAQPALNAFSCVAFGGGCAEGALCVQAARGGDNHCGSCDAGYRISTPTVAARRRLQTASGVLTSCADVLASDPNAASGTYELDLTSLGGGTISVYCDMTANGGGWTLVYTNNDVNLADEEAFGELPITPSSGRAKLASADVNRITRRATEPTTQYELRLEGNGDGFLSSTLMRATEPFYLYMNAVGSQIPVDYDCDGDGTYEASFTWSDWTADRGTSEGASWVRDWVYPSTGICTSFNGGNVLQWWSGSSATPNTANRPIAQTASGYSHSGIMALWVRPVAQPPEPCTELDQNTAAGETGHVRCCAGLIEVDSVCRPTPQCVGWAGTCTNGVLAAQSVRTMDDQCTSCNGGYYLVAGTAGCTDVAGWVDGNGFDCASVGTAACSDAAVVSGAGVTAAQACCACGGGDGTGMPAPATCALCRVCGGGAQEASACSSAADRTCECLAGYSTLSDDGTSCTAVACPADSTGVNVPDGCVCNAGYSGAVGAASQAPFYTTTCAPCSAAAGTSGGMFKSSAGVDSCAACRECLDGAEQADACTLTADRTCQCLAGYSPGTEPLTRCVAISCPANANGEGGVPGGCTCNDGYYGAVAATTTAPYYTSTCTAWAGTCTNGALIEQAQRTQEDHCGECNPGYYLDGATTPPTCVAYNGICENGELIGQAQRSQENHCGSCDAGYRLVGVLPPACVAWAGDCTNGALIDLAQRTQDNHCGCCSAGYRLDGATVPPTCPGWDGACTNGALIGQTARTQDDHCGLCDAGYYLDGATTPPTCPGWAGECANGALIGQTLRTQADHCGSCDPGYWLNAGDTGFEADSEPTTPPTCTGWAGDCANGALIGQTLRTMQNHCGSCDPGYWLNAGDGVVPVCVAYGGTCLDGTLITLAQRTQDDHCGECDAGYRLNGATTPPTCPGWDGACTHGALIGQTARTQQNHCGSCDPGYHLDGATTPPTCPGWAGECANGALIEQAQRTQADHCGECDAGYYLDGATTPPTCAAWEGACANGALVVQAARTQDHQCGTCNAGYYLNSAASPPTCPGYGGACLDGTLIVQELREQDNHCGECDPGHYLHTRTCYAWGGACANGELRPLAQRTGHDECGSCDDGYALAGINCDPFDGECTHGELLPQAERTGENQCGSCVAGYYLDPNSATLLSAGSEVNCIAYEGSCANGALRAQVERTADDQCGSCDVGYELADVSCVACDAGMFRAEEADSCTACPVGRYTHLPHESECAACAAGTAQPTEGTTACVACAVGTAQPEVGQGSCPQCAAGRVQPVAGMVACVDCHRGTVQPESGQAACVQCVAGQFQPAAGTTECVLCATGSAQVATGMTDCAVCLPGTVQPTAGQPTCDDCAPGTMMNDIGRLTCDECAAGTFQSATGATACAACSPGTTQPAAGSSACADCTAGQTQPSAGTSECAACAAGTVQPATGTTACVGCEVGTQQVVAGMTECDRCVAGKVMAQTGQPLCIDCAAGYVQPAEGMTSCTACAAGTHQPAAGELTCVACAPGQFEDGAGASACRNCAAGSFEQVGGSTACAACAVGTHQPEEGTTECDACAEGKVQDATGMRTCDECEVGKVQPAEGTTVCDFCSVGKQQGLVGQIACIDCVAGKSQAHIGASACVDCDAGRSQSIPGSATCADCAVGKLQPFGGRATCEDCATGQVQVLPGASTCDDCAVGKFQGSEGRTVCADCPAGRVQPMGGRTECEACGVGLFMPHTGFATCEQCMPGTVQPETGMAACVACVPGTEQHHGGATACELCTAGRTSATEGSASCDWCAPGQSQSEQGQTQCDACMAGKTQPARGTSDCVQCDAGTFQSQGGSTACAGCAAGSYQNNQGRTECAACGPGQVQPATRQARCEDCASGTWQSTSGRTACLACATGQAQGEEGAAWCLDCLPGEFQASTGQTRCDDCTAGMFSESAGAPQCVGCGAGQYNAVAGRSNCERCAAGQFKAVASDAACTACDAGKYGNADGQTECAACATGTYQPAVGSLACADCGAGRFMSDTHATACELCAAGTVAPQAGLSVCADCAVGTYQQAVGRTACADCPEGQEQPATGQAQCSHCAAGTVAPRAGQRYCDACTPGLFMGATGQTACAECAAGHYSAAATGFVVCASCAAGTYQASTGRSACELCAGPYADDLTDSEVTPLTEDTGDQLAGEYPVGGTYAPLAGAVACQGWEVCGVGFRVAYGGSRSRNRECAPCAQETWQDANGRCMGWSICSGSGEADSTVADRGVVALGTEQSDSVCEACPAGKISIVDDAYSPCADMGDHDGDGLYDRVNTYTDRRDEGARAEELGRMAYDAAVDFDRRPAPGTGGEYDRCPYDADNDADGDGICGGERAPRALRVHMSSAEGAPFYAAGGGRVDECPDDPDNDLDKDGRCDDVDKDVRTWDFYSHNTVGWRDRECRDGEACAPLTFVELAYVEGELPPMTSHALAADPAVTEVCDMSPASVTAAFSVNEDHSCDDLCGAHAMSCGAAAVLQAEDALSARDEAVADVFTAAHACGVDTKRKHCDVVGRFFTCTCVPDAEPLKTEEWSQDTLCPTCYATTQHDASATGTMLTEFKVKRNTLLFRMRAPAEERTVFVKLTVKDETAISQKKQLEGQPYVIELPSNSAGGEWYPVEWDLSQFVGATAVLEVTDMSSSAGISVDEFAFFNSDVACLPSCMTIRSDVCDGESCFFFERDATPYVGFSTDADGNGMYCRRDLSGVGSTIGAGLQSMGASPESFFAGITTAYLAATHLPACLNIDARGSYLGIAAASSTLGDGGGGARRTFAYSSHRKVRLCDGAQLAAGERCRRGLPVTYEMAPYPHDAHCVYPSLKPRCVDFQRPTAAYKKFRGMKCSANVYQKTCLDACYDIHCPLDAGHGHECGKEKAFQDCANCCDANDNVASGCFRRRRRRLGAALVAVAAQAAGDYDEDQCAEACLGEGACIGYRFEDGICTTTELCDKAADKDHPMWQKGNWKLWKYIEAEQLTSREPDDMGNKKVGGRMYTRKKVKAGRKHRQH